MEAFKVSSHLSSLLSSYPNAEDIMKAAIDGGEQSKIAIARLWLSEGIPFAFKEHPALYESVRSWLGVRLNVDPKEVNITGSGRIGQSLAPHKLGKLFSPESDLDLFVVSSDLFARMKSDFNKWSFDFETGKSRPKNAREETFWRDNINRGPKILARGFIDSQLVPNLDDYATIREISQTMWLLQEKLLITKDAPVCKSSSIRCYKDWASFVRQVVLSLV